jgi:streptogramin lyase
MIWFTHFGEQFLGKLDPKTGKVSEYPLPVIKPAIPSARSTWRPTRPAISGSR